MIRKRQNAVYAALLLALASAPLDAASFVYEGRLDDRGAAANGRYDVQLAVYQDAELGATLAEPMVFDAVEVVEGRFRLEFDAKLEGAEPAWVELAVRDAGGSSFSAIPGRTKATQAPAAIGACWSSVGDSGSNPATNFLGTTDAQPFVIRTRNAQSLRIEPSTVLFGGLPNTANVIAGSSVNTVSSGARGATISGGGAVENSEPGITGEAPNVVTAIWGSVGGGLGNRVTGQVGTIGGGSGNTAGDGTWSTVSGGTDNAASGTYSTIGGGLRASAVGFASTVGGGVDNHANGSYSSVAGGAENTASGSHSTVGGGSANTAGGGWSTVGGGTSNCAGADTSWAGGNRAKVRPGADPGGSSSCSGLTYPGGAGDQGSFVWADSQAVNFISTGPNQFLVRAAGGMAINTNDPAGSALRVNGDVRVSTLRVNTLGDSSGQSSPLCRNASFQIAVCPPSSKRYKDAIADLPPSLDAVLALRPVSYNWKVTGAPDIGFVAEEVAELDERLITRNDSGEIEGVKYERLSALLASAVQEMAAREQLQAREIDELRKDLAELRTLIESQRTGGR